MSKGGKSMNVQAAARIQGSFARSGNGQVSKGSFPARAMSAAMRNTSGSKPSGKK